MSGTLQASVVKDSASSTNNLALDSSGNVTAGANLYATGNVGIGTSSPGAKFDANGTSRFYGGAGLYIQGNITGGSPFITGGAIEMGATSTDATIQAFNRNSFPAYNLNLSTTTNIKFTTNSVERMRIDSSGNVEIFSGAAWSSGGLGPAGQQLTFGYDTANSIGYMRSANNGVAGTSLYLEGSIIRFNVGTASFSEAMRITTSGALLVGTTTGIGVGSLVGFVSGGNVLHIQSTSSSANNFVSYNSAGTATFYVSNGGAVSKTSGSFRIEHPLPALSATHDLVHSFIEGPQADLIYRGVVTLVNGTATVDIDRAAGMTEGTFVILCRDVQCFTSNESDWDAVKGSVAGNQLTIVCQNNASTAKVSWMVIGERQDPHMYETEWTDSSGKVIVEPLKSAKAV
jgi:hypothetical protein